MNDMVIVMTAVGTLALAMCALSARFGEIWGVDDGRMTPACERGRGNGGVQLLLRLLLALAAPAVLAGAYAQRLNGSLRLYGTFALVCGTAAYAALFVGMRAGGMGKAARMEAGGVFARVMELLAFLGCTAMGALMLREGAAACGYGAAQPESVWSGACILAAAMGLCVRLCGEYGMRIRREGDASPLCMGGAGIVALVCTVLSAAKKTTLIALLAPFAPVLRAVFALLCVVTAVSCARAAGRALRALFARESVLMRPKKKRLQLWLPLAVLLCAALAASPVSCLLEAAGVLGGAYALCALALCWLWLRRVGRGLLA